MDYKKKAEIFQVLSHPVRLEILDELRKGGCCVCHLQVVTHRPQAYVSQQLRILRDAGLVVDEKDGQNVFYHLCDDATGLLLKSALGEVESAKVVPHCSCPNCAKQS
jgi:DNA-binding transcriptional ArsR family regulator